MLKNLNKHFASFAFVPLSLFPFFLLANRPRSESVGVFMLPFALGSSSSKHELREHSG